jgi:hypothetical protein
MRLDGEGRHRFTHRPLKGRPGGTADTRQQASDARQALEKAAAVPCLDPLTRADEQDTSPR